MNKLAEDFAANKHAGQVDGLETYLSQISENAPKLFAFACKNYQWLKTIDQQLKFKEEDRETLEPMIDTLREYCENNPDNAFNLEICLQKMATDDNIYHEILYYIVYLFLK